MKIVVTGVAGFIGSNLARVLAAVGHEVVGVDDLSAGLKENIPPEVAFHLRDIRASGLERVFEGADALFHLAAKNCISDCQAEPAETASINVVGAVNVMDAARLAGVRKIIAAESSALYEGCAKLPSSEAEVRPESFYAVSKLAGRHFAEAFHRTYGMTFTALRYFCVYGPVQDYRRTIPPVMSAFIIKLLRGERPVIYGSGRKRRDFVYVDDVNRFHLQCLTDPRTDNRTFNLGSGVNHSILEIYDLVSDLLGIRVEPEFRRDLPGEARETLADIGAARRLGWEPRTDLGTGLQNSIAYIREEMRKGAV